MSDSDSQSILAGLVQRAEIADKEGKILKAAALLSEALLIDLEHESSAYQLLNIANELYDQEKYDQALLVFNLLRAISHEEFLFSTDYILFYAGLTLIALGEVERGETAVREAIEIDEDNPEFLKTWGYYLLGTERYEKGIEVLYDAISIDYEDIDTTLEAIAWAYFKNNKPKEALQFLQDVFEVYIYDGSLQVYFRFLNLLDEQTAINASEWLLTKINDLIDQDHYEGELIHQILDGINHLHRVLDIKINIMSGRLDHAEELVMGWIEEEPNNLNANIFNIKVKLSRKDYKAALDAINTSQVLLTKESKKEITDYDSVSSTHIPNLNEFEPDPMAELLLAKADALTGLERYQEALETVEQAQKRFPDQLIFYRYAASLLLKIGNLQKALIQISSARDANLDLDDPTLELERKIKERLIRND